MAEIERQTYTETDLFDGVLVRALTADGGPSAPPTEWFTPPTFLRPTPLTVTADGRIFGHIAAFGTRHIGLPGNVTPPRSRSGYAYYKTGVVRTAEGHDQPVGQLTLAGGHAPLSADAASAVQHYDDTDSTVADVNAGEDRHGIWVAGALRPDVTDSQVRALRASAPSGDWRPINGRLELIAVCQVNAPGFPIPRAECLVAGGAPVALVAAGAQDMWQRRQAEAIGVYDRLTAVEDAVARAGLKARVAFAVGNRK